MDKRIIIVIPTRNDEITIGSVILKARIYSSIIIVVDDGSTDRTVEIAQSAGAEVIILNHDSGKGTAIITGLKRAGEINGDVVVLIDGDIRYKTREISLLIEYILTTSTDVVIGSQYLGLNGDIPLKQKFKQNLLLMQPSNTIQEVLTDPFSGFMAFNANALKYLNFEFTPQTFHEIFINNFLKHNLVIKEISVSVRQHTRVKHQWDYSQRTIVAFPAYNEEKTLPYLIESAKPYADIILVVDDGSADATVAVSRAMGAYVIRHHENKGYGGAIQTIFSTARDLNAEALVILDSDGQHNPKDIQQVLKPLLHGMDVVIGSRFIDGSKGDIPKYRKVGMKVLDTATAVAGVKNVTDTQSGFRGYGKRAINSIEISGNGMSAGSEILIQAHDHNFSLKEVPITVRYDLEDTSSQNPLYHGISVLSNLIALISYRRPLPTFGIPGILLFILGLIAAFLAFKEYYLTTKFPFTLSIMGGISLILGLLLGIAGLILNAFLVLMPKK